ncbi:hypothetical protein V9K67_05385 [Paraflavisolibacter sp. H34]|uniref:hypothetical protein n=1 Tax=Huijunlia imazamoxiresistens TaxID=3127457 RepID=UPI0030171BB8
MQAEQPKTPSPAPPLQDIPLPEVKSAEEVLQQLEAYFEAPVDAKVNSTQSNAAEADYLDTAYKHAQVEKIKDDNIGRKRYAELIFAITVIWLFIILMIVIQCGKGTLRLSDAVLITLITTTTASVFGFFLLVVNYYFNKDKST